jgi:uncharacterized protein YcgL (UPF0745 family)
LPVMKNNTDQVRLIYTSIKHIGQYLYIEQKNQRV